MAKDLGLHLRLVFNLQRLTAYLITEVRLIHHVHTFLQVLLFPLPILSSISMEEGVVVGGRMQLRLHSLHTHTKLNGKLEGT